MTGWKNCKWFNKAGNEVCSDGKWRDSKWTASPKGQPPLPWASEGKRAYRKQKCVDKNVMRVLVGDVLERWV